MGSLGDFGAPIPTSRISTVVPATPRGDESREHQLTYMDLLMKLHYIRPVYFFDSEAVKGLSIYDLKKPMFPLLDPYSHVSGRIRRSESGRPFIKCNDAGVRIAESRCDWTMKEWLVGNGCSIDGLFHDHVLGPDLGFSPLVFVKFTRFKCGGLSVGLSWSHVLGDAFSALNFITKWSQIMAGHVPPKYLHLPKTLTTEPKSRPNNSVSEMPISIKSARIIGEYWLATNDSDVATHSFHVTSKHLDRLGTDTKTTSYFATISALIWKTIAQVREDSGEFGPRVVTICTNGSVNRGENEFPSNGLVLSKIELDFEARKSDVSELAKLIAEKKIVENRVVEKLVEEDEGKEDFIVYGANLTFVDLEEADFYGVKLNGKKPVMANCSFRGVGDQGVVLVLPAPEDDDDGGNGRIVTVSLPRIELEQLKNKLEDDGYVKLL